MANLTPSNQQVNAIIELFSNRNYDKALEALKPLCKDYPKESLLHNIRGACYAGLSQFDAAIESYNKAIKINPKYYKAFFNLGSAFEEIGQIEKSITSYKKSLIIEPTYAEAHNNLGNALRQVGKLDEAANSFKEALVIKPDYVEALYSLGFTYQELGQLTEAVKCYESVLEEKPDFAEMHNNLGVLLQKLNQPKEAIKYLKQALIILPLFKEAHNNLGNVLKAEGNLDDAINSYQKAISIEPNYIEAHNNLGSVFFELNHLEDAAECYKKALTIKPDDAEGQYNLGFILQSLGQFDQAILCYQKVLNINPDYIDAHNNLGISFKEAGKFNEALQCYEKTINLNPEYAQAHNNIGNILVELGQSDKALESYRKAIEINPEYAEAHNNLGIIQMNLGHLNEAIKCYTKAIDLRTDYASAHLNLSALKKFIAKDRQYIQMNAIYSSKKTNQLDRIEICFALAKANEDLGKKDDFFKFLNEANYHRKEELNYSIKKDEDDHLMLRSLFNGAQPKITTEFNNPQAKSTIFIVGMPRSGTSLVEQIISSHHQVHGAGEMGELVKFIPPLLNQMMLENSNSIKEKDLESIRIYYQGALSMINVSENIVTDKSPLNFEYIGFILSAFPEAKIVHLKRDPRAICWSIYKHYFSDRGIGWAYNIEDLVDFYGLYSNLMSFWHDLFPNKIYDICYEDLTINQEEETRKLLDYCDLDWDDNCLDFHKNKRAVETASATQVKKKMYKGSSDAWKQYKSHLKPLIKGLRKYNNINNG